VPYRLFDLDGVTVAVIGAATDFIGPAYAMREADELLEFLPTEESIGDLVAMLDERADIVVLLTHLGKWEDRQLAKALPGVDIIFGGHDHVLTDDVFIPVGTDAIVQHSGSDGYFIGELTVGWDGDRIVEPEVRLIWVADELPASVAVEEVHQEYLSLAPTPAE
jgi:2',3'-cyclic-nucleotide 2'-phosphodiesterase (5'-nucleotidase family)